MQVLYGGRDPFNQNSKFFRLDRTDPFSFRPKFPEILVEWIASGETLVIKNFRKSSEGSYTCRARNALTTIEAKVKINAPIPASCSEVKKYISSVSGNYVIDPDGEGGLAPVSFEVILEGNCMITN